MKLRPSPGPWKVWKAPIQTRDEWLKYCAELWDTIPENKRTDHPLIVTTGKGSRARIVALFLPTKKAEHNATLVGMAPDLLKVHLGPFSWLTAKITLNEDKSLKSFIWNGLEMTK